jgi:cysteine desulfurase / selenocysteine lyase
MVSLVVSQRDPRAHDHFDAEILRKDFPIMSRMVHERPLVYLDNAASCQKPRSVIDAMTSAYETAYANVHRGVHALSEEATVGFETARRKVATFINADSADEIVFVRGATEAINLVASSYGRMLRAGDEVVLTYLEHHSNIVPWQMLRDTTGIVLKIVPVDDNGGFLFDEYERLLSDRTKVVAITHVSNALGTVTPVEDIVARAHAQGAVVLVDGCQAVPHMAVDVQRLDADFYVFSSHKLYGPTGIGVLYGKKDILESLPPYQGGGEMILSVSFERTTYKDSPHRFEAGTPAIVEAVGLGAAIDYVQSIGLDDINAHEQRLLDYATERLFAVPGLRIVGPAGEKAAIISFTMDFAHPHDVATILDRTGVAIRAGHHCAQPLMNRLGLSATARASFAAYNTFADVDALVDGIGMVREVFG